MSLLSSTDLRSSEVSNIRVYLEKIFLIQFGGLRGLLLVIKGIIVFWVVFCFSGCSRSSRFLENALLIALLTSCVG